MLKEGWFSYSNSIVTEMKTFYFCFSSYASVRLALFCVAQVVAFNNATSGDNSRNMEAVDVRFQMAIGRIRVVFLNRFVMRLLVSQYFIFL